MRTAPAAGNQPRSHRLDVAHTGGFAHLSRPYEPAQALPDLLRRAQAAPRWPAGLLAAAGTVLLLGGGWWVLSRGGEPGARPEADAPAATALAEPGRTKLVVLPFQNLGPAEHEYFADGITDEITSRFAAIKQLGVISRTSAIQYNGTDKTLKQVGQELDVDYVLEGTILWQERPAVTLDLTEI